MTTVPLAEVDAEPALDAKVVEAIVAPTSMRAIATTARRRPRPRIRADAAA
jgi:hypothetical protein